MSKKVHGFLVKYALTEGIMERTADTGNSGYVYIPGRFGSTQAKLGKTFFTDREEAEAAARKMALRKIASLERQIPKLRSLVETPKWEAEP